MKISKTEKLAGICTFGTGIGLLAIGLIIGEEGSSFMKKLLSAVKTSSAKRLGLNIAGGILLSSTMAFAAITFTKICEARKNK